MTEPSRQQSALVKYAGKVASVFMTLFVLVLVLLFALEGVDSIPDNAMVYVDESKTYYSPPLLWDDSRSFHIAMSVAEVRARGFRHVSLQPSTGREWGEVTQAFEFVWVQNHEKTWTEFRPHDGICVITIKKGAIKGRKEYSPDRTHANSRGFHGNSHSLIVHLLGLNRSRWTANGTWKW